MHVTVVTLFPDMFASVLGAGVLGKAIETGLVTVNFVDPRDFTRDRHRSVNDSPYGGGPGMVMKVNCLVNAIEAASARTEAASHRVLMTPAGAPLSQARVRELAARPHLVIVCGRYEGIDDRVVELAIDEELSVGDFVLSGGEIGALAVIDAVARYVPGVLGAATSTDEESFSAGLLEYPHYTRPLDYRGLSVPEVLTSGDHSRIAAWRHQRALERTAARRPELLAGGDAPGLVALAARTYVALVHHPVLDREGARVTSSITNLDVHDIARSSATYGLAGYYVVTPVAAQREKAERIVTAWPDHVGDAADNRVNALALVRTAPALADVCHEIGGRHKRPPLVVATSARPGQEPPRVGFARLLAEALADDRRPLLLCLGTGWGLAPELVSQCDRVLAPIRGAPKFNHLSVRSAAASILDRLFGLRA